MIQLVYVSSSTKPFTKDELIQLLDKSRQNNKKLGITGMLLYKDGDFMQALEGDETKVHALSAQIAKDPRHSRVTTLLEAPCSTREFPDWSMGFRNLTDMDPREVPGYSTFLDSPLRAQSFTKSPGLCRTLLLLFKAKSEVA
ncbi:MAG TPA: BLUF domain-containing protein [Candidatus Acidoferrales bacterium]|jgi:hypothetical protein|nr:BLUF domain-containing protein [Candidatus Acidoferrales bacterium]